LAVFLKVSLATKFISFTKMASYYHYHSLTLDASWQDTEFLSKMIAAFEKNGYDQIVVSKEADGTILIRYRFACDTPKGRKTYTTGW
jgi:urease accessory protein UreH